MDISLKNTPSSKEIQEIFGSDFEVLKSKLLKDSNYTCQCCGWEGAKEIENRRHLTLCIDSINEENPKETPVFVVCKSCYLINHIDNAVEHGFVALVNSSFSQEDLIKISWSDCSKKNIVNSNRQKAIEDKKIIPLKKDPKIYLDQIKGGTSSGKLKVIFNNNFLKS